MGWFSGKSDGPAYAPGRNGLEPLMRNGRPVMLSELSKDQLRSIGMGGATKRAPRAERKQRKEWGR